MGSEQGAQQQPDRESDQDAACCGRGLLAGEKCESQECGGVLERSEWVQEAAVVVAEALANQVGGNRERDELPKPPGRDAQSEAARRVRCLSWVDTFSRLISS